MIRIFASEIENYIIGPLYTLLGIKKCKEVFIFIMESIRYIAKSIDLELTPKCIIKMLKNKEKCMCKVRLIKR